MNEIMKIWLDWSMDIDNQPKDRYPIVTKGVKDIPYIGYGYTPDD